MYSILNIIRYIESELSCIFSDIQDVFQQLAQLSVDQVELGKTKQKYGL